MSQEATVILSVLVTIGTTLFGAWLNNHFTAVQEQRKALERSRLEARQKARQINSLIARMVIQFPGAIDSGRQISAIYEVSQDHSSVGNGLKVAGYLLNQALELNGTEFEEVLKPLVDELKNWLRPGADQLSTTVLKETMADLEAKLAELEPKR